MINKLILASASPRRAELLTQIGLEFEVVVSEVPEILPSESTMPGQLVMELAARKAEQVAQSVAAGVVLGADTVVVLQNRILGKPEGAEEAFKMLSLLSDREHSVFTGVALIETPTGRSKQFFAETKVKFRKLDREEILTYLATGEPFDKAGAYGIQGKGAALVESINGCYFNVVGLPLSKLKVLLRDFGITL